jgi:hypothetical protein
MDVESIIIDKRKQDKVMPSRSLFQEQRTPSHASNSASLD